MGVLGGSRWVQWSSFVRLSLRHLSQLGCCCCCCGAPSAVRGWKYMLYREAAGRQAVQSVQATAPEVTFRIEASHTQSDWYLICICKKTDSNWGYTKRFHILLMCIGWIISRSLAFNCTLLTQTLLLWNTEGLFRFEPARLNVIDAALCSHLEWRNFTWTGQWRENHWLVSPGSIIMMVPFYRVSSCVRQRTWATGAVSGWWDSHSRIL